MARIIAILVVGMLCAQFLSCPVGAEGIDVRYGVVFTHPESHVAEIELFVYNMDDTSLILTMRKCLGGPSEKPIINLKAFTRVGRRLTFEFWREGEACFWKIEPSETSEILVNYLISMNYRDDTRRGGAYMSYLGAEYGATRAAWTFLVPYDRKVDSIKVRYFMTPWWKPVTPWREEGGTYFSDSLNYFITSTFAMGDFTLYRKTIGETELTLAIWNGFDEEMRAQISENSFRIFEYMRDAWGAGGPPTHLCIFLPPTGDGRDMGMLEYTQSQALVFRDTKSSANTFASRISHIWNGWLPYGMLPVGSEEEWFGEGVNAYYGDKTLFELGIDSSHSTIREMYEGYLENIVGSKYDVPVTEAHQFLNAESPADFAMSDVLIHQKGALLSFMLDYEIKEKTNGEKSINDLVRQMYIEFGPGGDTNIVDWSLSGDSLPYSNNDIKRILNAITGDDFTPFFDEYVYGTKTPDVDGYLLDTDDDGLIDLDEKYVGTNPHTPDTDGDGVKDGKDPRPLVRDTQASVLPQTVAGQSSFPYSPSVPASPPLQEQEETGLGIVPFLVILLVIYLRKKG